MTEPVTDPRDLPDAARARAAFELARAEWDRAIATCLDAGRSYAQIADATGLSKPTIQKMAQRIRRDGARVPEDAATGGSS